MVAGTMARKLIKQQALRVMGAERVNIVCTHNDQKNALVP